MLLDQPFLHCRCDRQVNIHLLFTASDQAARQQRDDLLHIFFMQRMEDHNLIDSIDELRLEQPLYFLHHIGLHLIIVLLLRLFRAKTKVLGINDPLRACIGSHDEDRIFEADFSSLGVRDMSVVKYLQQNIEYIRMRLLYLVKQHNGIGIAADLLRQLSALLKPYVTGR